jgi:hypothetical protein
MSANTSESSFSNDNLVTICRSVDGKRLTKIIYFNEEKKYEKAYHFVFRNMQVESLLDLYTLTKQFLYKEYCCFVRGVAYDDTITTPRRRLLHDDNEKGDKATIFERACNWFALDIDGIGTATGNLKEDAMNVLLALDLRHVECFAVASSGYMRKPGIHLRLFFWNDEPITCITLKKYFKAYDFVDGNLFGPVQPIYIARPIFTDGMKDPCKQPIVWLPSKSQTTNITEIGQYGVENRPEDRQTKAQAIRFRNKIFRELEDTPEKKRHDTLINLGILMAKLCAQGHFDEDEMKEELEAHVFACWHGNRKKDVEAIEYAFKKGTAAMENNNDSF